MIYFIFRFNILENDSAHQINNLKVILTKQEQDIKFLNDEEKSSFTNGNKILTELHEDLSNLIDAYSRNFRNKFNQILKEKLSKLQNDEED